MKKHHYPTTTPPTDDDLALTGAFAMDSVATAFVASATNGASSLNKKVVRLYTAVRDEIRYTPYSVTVDPNNVRPGTVIDAGAAYCIPKAILYAACLRSIGIPARIGYADVINHMSSPKLDALLRSELFVAHGYTALFLDGRWIRATPTFNRELCQKVGLSLLEFDGQHDALFHPFDLNGNRHMEYVRYHGEFAKFDPEFILNLWRVEYPHWFTEDGSAVGILEAAGGRDEVFDDPISQ